MVAFRSDSADSEAGPRRSGCRREVRQALVSRGLPSANAWCQPEAGRRPSEGRQALVEPAHAGCGASLTTRRTLKIGRIDVWASDDYPVHRRRATAHRSNSRPSVAPGIDGNVDRNVDKGIDCEAVSGNPLVQRDANHRFNGVTRALPHPSLALTGVHMESSAHRVVGVGRFEGPSPRVLATPGR